MSGGPRTRPRTLGGPSTRPVDVKKFMNTSSDVKRTVKLGRGDQEVREQDRRRQEVQEHGRGHQEVRLQVLQMSKSSWSPFINTSIKKHCKFVLTDAQRRLRNKDSAHVRICYFFGICHSYNEIDSMCNKRWRHCIADTNLFYQASFICGSSYFNLFLLCNHF